MGVNKQRVIGFKSTVTPTGTLGDVSMGQMTTSGDGPMMLVQCIRRLALSTSVCAIAGKMTRNLEFVRVSV